MKINIFLNNYFVQYKQNFIEPDISLDINILKKIPLDNNKIILRGEPTLHRQLNDILFLLHKKDYILTTDGEKVENLFSYKGQIPYISFHYDGFMNDIIRGNRSYLTKNILRALDFYAGKKTTTRISYTINKWNTEWFNVDVKILRHLLEKYPKMKRPYFLICQQGAYFMQEEFYWQPINITMIDTLNKNSLLTEKNIRMLAAYYDKATYECIAPENEITITPDGYVRLCMSHKINDVLGNLHNESFDEILKKSEEQRLAARNCNVKKKCFLAHHYKYNINRK